MVKRVEGNKESVYTYDLDRLIQIEEKEDGVTTSIKTLAYDDAGNLFTDGEFTYTWQMGRQLQGITGTGLTTSYMYNENGLRTQKTVNGQTHEYTLLGSSVTREVIRDNTGNILWTIHYSYAGEGTPVSMNVNGTEYYYLKNAQGDITHIVDGDGNEVASYEYDAWGNHLSIAGGEIAELNPYRYRGYRYDSETGLFYVGSRYYDPEIGRWISPEPNVDFGGFDDGAGLLAYNVYAYCANNPVNFCDPTGEFIITTTTLIVGGIIIGALAGGTAGGYYSYKKFGKVKWQYVTGGAVIGGVIGGLVGWGAGAILTKFGVLAASSSITAGGGAGFKSFEALKNFLGSPGWGKQWHHIVEQCQQAKSGFSTFWINNSNNVINITKEVHQKISAYYSSIPKEGFTNGLRFRDWLAGQSFEKQYEWGVKILRMFGVKIQ